MKTIERILLLGFRGPLGILSRPEKLEGRLDQNEQDDQEVESGGDRHSEPRIGADRLPEFPMLQDLRCYLGVGDEAGKEEIRGAVGGDQTFEAAAPAPERVSRRRTPGATFRGRRGAPAFRRPVWAVVHSISL